MKASQAGRSLGPSCLPSGGRFLFRAPSVQAPSPIVFSQSSILKRTASSSATQPKLRTCSSSILLSRRFLATAQPRQSAPPRSELPRQEIDEQFDRVYEKVFNKKRPSRDPDAPDPFNQDWRERLFDMVFSNAGTLFMMTVVVSLGFHITREQGEHKEYKRLTTARLDEAERALRLHQAQLQRTVDTKRQELATALVEFEQTNGKAGVPPEEVKRLLDGLLASFVADASHAAEAAEKTVTAEDSAAPASTASGDQPEATAPSGYRKVV